MASTLTIFLIFWPILFGVNSVLASLNSPSLTPVSNLAYVQSKTFPLKANCDPHDPACKPDPCDPHDPNCQKDKDPPSQQSCDPHDPACKCDSNGLNCKLGDHGEKEMETWMKRMLCKFL
jgi:hypothetical protein